MVRVPQLEEHWYRYRPLYICVFMYMCVYLCVSGSDCRAVIQARAQRWPLATKNKSVQQLKLLDKHPERQRHETLGVELGGARRSLTLRKPTLKKRQRF